MAMSGRPLSASTQSEKNQERSRREAGLLEEFLEELPAPGARAEAASGVFSGRVGAQSGGERGVAGEVAEHPEDVGSLGAVVDRRNGLGERLAGAFAGAGRLGEREGGAARFERFESFLAAGLLFDPEGSHKVGDAFAEPGAGTKSHPRVSEGVGEDAVELVGRGLANGGDEERAGFEGRVFGVGQIEDGELGARRLAQPALKKGRDEGGGRGPAFDGGLVGGEGEERGVGGLLGRADGEEEAGSFKAEGGAIEAGGGDAGDFVASG